ncbi:MAG: NTP transferase domain-containing protein [Candidatus Omnitrophica bacterium]|nr:NTP transferase domain-containing protein [Candidatus Omnitrophota bacterium]
MKSERPKVLHRLCGRPMIAYAIDLAAAAGVKQPVLVIGHGEEQVRPLLPKEAKVVVQGKALGTGDAVRLAKKSLGATGDVLILYADTPLVRRTTIHKMIESHFKTGATCTLLTAHLADPSGYGRIQRNEAGQLTGVVEEADANAAQRAIREVNIGPLVCKIPALTQALAQLKPSGATKEFYLTQLISQIGQQEGAKLQAARAEEAAEALGVNSQTELARAISVIRQRIIETHLHNGVMIEDPQTTVIDYGVAIGHDTVIRPHTVIETGVSIGRRCAIGPFARLRSGVTLGDDVRVGNFAELVRTKVGARVRINHVSYLGDATIEDDVNIGAGTITANYDGTAKHPTHIGKGAFIGSDTVLIAPVKVGAGAVTGAGSVVPKDHDVPAKGVVIGVPARPLNGRSAVDGAKPGKAAPQPSARRALAVAAKARPAPKRLKKAAKPAARRRPAAKPKKRPAPKRRASRASRPRPRKAAKRR